MNLETITMFIVFFVTIYFTFLLILRIIGTVLGEHGNNLTFENIIASLGWSIILAYFFL